MERKRILELDKICRVCISERKDMRPLFSEKVAEMLMECASINVKPTEGWPDKICVQCVHSVSRCHAFKMLAERSDKELREYINSLTIRVVIDGNTDTSTAAKQSSNILMTNDDQDDSDCFPVNVSSPHQPLTRQSEDTLRSAAQQVQQDCRETFQFKSSQRKQVKSSKLTLKQMQHQEQETSQQYSSHGKRKVPISRKQQSLAKKQQQESNQLQAQQQHQLQNQHHEQTLTQTVQQQILQQQTVSLAEPVTMQTAQRLQVPQTPPILSTTSQLLPLNATPSSAPSTTVLPGVSAALPQQLLLPNGQIITTAQILTTNGGPPQLAHIITNPGQTATPTPAPSTVSQLSQPQFTPHLLQTTGGQTLQLIQQPNGQHVLQLMHLVPQRTSMDEGNGTATATIIDNHDHLTIMDEDTLIEQAEQHLIDDDDDLEEVNTDINHSGTQVTGNRSLGEQTICDTIVIDDDQLQMHHHHHQHHHHHHQQQQQQQQHQHHHHHHILSHSDVQELEYLEDITVTTTTQQQQQSQQQQRHQHLVLHEQHAQHLLSEATTVVHEVDDDDDIIEEIHIEDDMLEDDDGGHDTVLLDASGSEFLQDQEDDMVVNHQMMNLDNQEDDCDQDNIIVENEFDADENTAGTLTHYAVMTDDDNGTLMETAAGSVLQVACGQNLPKTPVLRSSRHNRSITMQSSSNKQNMKRTNHNSNNSNINNQNDSSDKNSNRSGSNGGNGSKKQKRWHNMSKALANSKLLAATATSIAAAGDDDFEVDTKLIAEFINQQTMVMSSGRYMCNLCRQDFRQLKGLQNHMHLHSNWIRANCRKLPTCEICHKSFKGPGMLKMHMKSHVLGAKEPTCQICGKTFKTKAILYRHRQTHQLRWYLCAVPYCRGTFSSPVSLKGHVDRQHPDMNDVAKYKCGVCFAIFYTVEELGDHIRNSGHGSNALSMTTVSLSGTMETIPSELVGSFDTEQHSSLLDHGTITLPVTDGNASSTSTIASNHADDRGGGNGTMASASSTSSVSTISNHMELGTAVTMTEVVNSNGEVFIVTPA